MADVLLKRVKVLTSARGKLLRNASIVVEAGRIVEVSERKSDVSADIVVDGEERMIAVPGFVNAHVHTEETLWMNRVPDTVRHVPWFEGWILPYYKNLGERDAYWSSLLSQMIMLKGGTSCYADSANTDPELAAEAAERCGIRAFIARWTCDIGDYRSSSIKSCVSETELLLRKYSKDRVKALASVIGVNQCSNELYMAMKDLADRHGSVITSHEASGHEDVARSLKRLGKRPVENLQEIGFLSTRTLLSHVTDVTDNEVGLLKRSKTRVALCPITELKKGKGLSHYGKLPQILGSGINACVGTDTANSSNHLDVLRTGGTLSLLAKDFSMDPEIVDARRVIELITSEGASCLGMRRYGNLSVGNIADIAVFEPDKLSWFSDCDVVQGLVYGGGLKTYATIVDGRAAYVNGRFSFVDEDEVIRESKRRAERIQRRITSRS